MKDLSVDGESGVRHDWDRRIQERVVGAVDTYVEPHSFECVTVMHRADPVTKLSKLARHRFARPQAQARVGRQCGFDRLVVRVIDVLVRDQHRVRLVEHIWAQPRCQDR